MMALLKKAFAWSYSQLKAYETCAFQWQQVQLLKNFKGTEGPELIWGNRVHHAMHKTLKPGSTVPLPDELILYKPWVDSILALPGTRYVEQKYAITKDFAPCEYFAHNVWFRGIGDVVVVSGSVAYVGDWKTGKVLDDPVQLLLMAQLIFSHFPKVKRVQAQFIWLKFDCSSEQVVTRQDIADNWVGLMDRVRAMTEAYDTDNFPKNPSGLCRKHCPVRSCQYWGKGSH
jgi:PD-(D/E)XK nuclease superfamily